MTEIDLGWVGRSTYPPGSSYGPYTASTYEVIWIERGRVSLEVAGEVQDLRAHSVVLSRPGEVNLYRWDPARQTRHGWLHLEVPGGLAACPRVHHFPRREVVHSLLSHVCSLERQRPAQWHDLASEAVAYVLRLLVTGALASRPSTSTPLPRVVERALHHVVDEWSGSTTLAAPSLRDLAAAASVTPEHLTRAVARETGHGPIGLLRVVRLRHAASLLVRSDLLVSSVAERSGFTSPFHFSRAFAAQFGLSPSAFREQPHPGPDLPPAVQELFEPWL